MRKSNYHRYLLKPRRTPAPPPPGRQSGKPVASHTPVEFILAVQPYPGNLLPFLHKLELLSSFFKL